MGLGLSRHQLALPGRPWPICRRKWRRTGFCFPAGNCWAPQRSSACKAEMWLLVVADGRCWCWLRCGWRFGASTEVLLGLAVLLLSGLCLLAAMALAGWSWNLLNLMALPLVLGTGVDYGIFMQLALRRHGGDSRLVRRSVGPRAAAVRRHGHRRFRLAGVVRQRRHGQPGQSLRGGHRRQHADLQFFCCPPGGRG